MLKSCPTRKPPKLGDPKETDTLKVSTNSVLKGEFRCSPVRKSPSILVCP